MPGGPFGNIFGSGESFEGPFIEPHIRLKVRIPEADQRITASVEDTLQEDVTRKLREKGVYMPAGIITNFVKGDYVVFDLETDESRVSELEDVQSSIIRSVNKYTGTTVDAADVEVVAAVVRHFVSPKLTGGE